MRTELKPEGLEVVTVALDTAGPEACRKHVLEAGAQHPSAIDEAHVVDELFGIVNVPNGVWIDEEGVIVRPAEPAWTRTIDYSNIPIPEDAPPERVELIELTRGLRIEGDVYVSAIRDWVSNGSASRFALTPDEVIARSHPRSEAIATAAAQFELGQHLHRAGFAKDAVFHFREAHRLHPSNWTYKRQAWSLTDPQQGPAPVYDGNWADDVRSIGPENYYPAFEP